MDFTAVTAPRVKRSLIGMYFICEFYAVLSTNFMQANANTKIIFAGALNYIST